MNLVPIPFCGQTYSEQSLNASAQRAVNLYPFRVPVTQYTDKAAGQQLPGKIVMYPTPGFNPFVQLYDSVPTAEIRGMIVINNTLYSVVGNKFRSFSHTTFDVALTLGTLNTSTGRCSIVTNTADITISDGQYGYVYNLTTGAFTQIATTGGFPVNGVTNLTFQDGYYLAVINNSRTVIQSALLDGTTWPALAFDTTVSFPDNAVAVFSDQIILYVFGPTITEPQSDVGSIPYAFQKVASVLIQAGCAARDSIVKVGTTIMFLANDAAGSPYIAEMIGYNAKPVSTPPINEAIAQYLRNGETISDAHAYTYREGDSQFYSITFPSVNGGLGATWVADVKERLFHERGMFNNGYLQMRDAVEHYVSWLGLHYISTIPQYTIDPGFSPRTNYIFEMSQVYSTEVGFSTHTGMSPSLKRIRTCQHTESSGMTLFINELFVDIEPGIGVQDDKLGALPTSAQNPLATLEISRDSGHTWHSVGVRPMGVAGKYLTRLSWRALGRVRKTVTFRLTITDAVRCYIMGAFANIKPGTK